jgi:putative flavoprotein involved in K+ transport
VWRSPWDSLRLFTPAAYDALPDLPFPAPADCYPGKDEVADYLCGYATTFELPVRLAPASPGSGRTAGGTSPTPRPAP